MVHGSQNTNYLTRWTDLMGGLDIETEKTKKDHRAGGSKEEGN